MTKITIKNTSQDDIPALKKVLDQIELFPSDMLEDMIAPALNGESNALWLTAMTDQTPVGLCYAEPEELTDRAWNVLALGVEPNLQGHGIGKELMAAIEARLVENMQRLLIVDTSSTDAFESARSFYRSIGYSEEARIRDYWAEGDDKITFRKAL